MRIGLNQKLIFLVPLVLLFGFEFLIAVGIGSSGLKTISLGMMIIYIMTYGHYDKNLLVFTFLALFFILLNFDNDFSLMASGTEFIRYLSVIAMLLFGYAIRHHYKVVLSFIVAVTLISDVFQLFLYVGYFGNLFDVAGVARIKDGGMIINSGFLGISNAFLNFVSFIIAFGIFKSNKLAVFFYVFTLSTLSYKTIPFLFLAHILLTSYKWKAAGAYLMVVVIAAFMLQDVIEYLNEMVVKRVDYYLLIGNSARFESYRVAFEYLNEDLSHWVHGLGLGSFGGPSSTYYDSPVYEKYAFDWFGYDHLDTTDTYYPHLIVELGLVGAVTYLLLFFVPLFQKSLSRKALMIILLINLTFLFESFFSFGLNNLIELSASIMLYYGIIELYKKENSETRINGH